MRNRYVWGFAIAAAILSLVGLVILSSTQRFRNDSRLVAKTFAVIGQLETVEAGLLDGIGAQRSYLLTGDRHYLDSYQTNHVRLESQLAALTTLVNPVLAPRAKELGKLVELRMDTATSAIHLYESEGLSAAQAHIRSNRGLRISQQISKRLAAMHGIEQRLLKQRQQAADRSESLLLAIGVLGIPLSLVILSWIFVLLSREVRERARAEANATTLNTDLERTVSELERASGDLRELSRYTGLLQSCRNVSEALVVTRGTLSGLLPECAGLVYLLRASQDYAEAECSWGEHVVESHPLLIPHECWALRRAQPHCIDDIHAGTACTHLDLPPADVMANTACLPLTAQGMSLGFLYLSAPGRGPLPRLSIATTAAEQLSLALSNLRLQDTLRQQSIRDVLTGLYNRRYLEESLLREVARCERRGLPLAVMMLDLDHFKTFNDSHGHEGGDALLAAFGRLLQSTCRTEDIPCRYGGEEFTLILPEATFEAALHRAGEIRAAVEQMTVRHLQRDIGGVTVSVGLAMFPTHGSNADQLLRVADAALYRAKHSGRNRVEMHERVELLAGA
ncbi:MAG: diguanylate cyclase [Pseudomonadota bacterium]|nr:diguanylate cyclase [Pseudomonadota bacterium]